jgi:hypothetical protein
MSGRGGLLEVLAAIIPATVEAAHALDEHRREHQVHAESDGQKCQLAELVAHEPAGDLREPVIDTRETGQRWSLEPRHSGSGR